MLSFGRLPTPSSRVIIKVIAALAKYKILGKLGQGGMGEVYRAEDPALLRTVAIKVISKRQPDAATVEQRFLREARSASAVSHPNIVTIYEIGETEDSAYIVMEYIEGRNIRELISTHTLPASKIVGIALQVCDALHEAHSRGVIHRDIKPENILVNDRWHVKLVDFGLAKGVPAKRGTGDPFTESLTEDGTVMGTLSYMSPEQLRGEPLDERTDIFSFGIVLYEMLSGRVPFAGDNPFEIAASIIKDQASTLKDVPVGIPTAMTRVLSTMLKRDREHRYRNFLQVRTDLHNLGSMSIDNATTVELVAEGGPTAHKSERRSLIPTVLVLPLETVGDEEGSFIGVGLAHAITTDLAKIGGLAVLSKSAGAGRIGEHGLGARELARELGANIMLEGEVVRSGGTLGVMARLTDVETGRVIWGSQYRGDAADLFSIQDAVCESVAAALQLSVSGEVRTQLGRPATNNIEAFELYSKGRAFLERRDVAENIDFAVGVFQEALILDPEFALAHAGLSEAYWHKYQLSRDNQWVEPAIAAGDHALVLDPTQPRVYLSLGIIYHGTGRLDRAIEQFKRAADLSPASDEAQQWLGRCALRQGDMKTAVRYLERAIELRPGYWENYNALGTCYYTFGRYRNAAEQFRRVITFQPDNYLGYDNLGGIYCLLGRYGEAALMHRRAIQIYPNHRSYSNLGTTCFYLGKYDESAGAYRSAIELNPRDDSHHSNLGDVLRRLGQSEAARSEFEIAGNLLKDHLLVNSEDAEALARLAVVEAKLGSAGEANAVISKALGLEQYNTTIMYQRALVGALCNEPDSAMEWLEKALSCGYSRSEAERDPDLESLRDREDYKALFAGGTESRSSEF
ncbi:MAG TPA: protein kinase [Blastocatellia bacterium]|nr:protein kinase [Blastocatellia bacterium]